MKYIVIYKLEGKQVNQFVNTFDELKKLGKNLQKSRIDYKVLTNIKRRK